LQTTHPLAHQQRPINEKIRTVTALKILLNRCLPTLAKTACLLAVSVLSARAENTKVAEVAGATLFRDKGCAYCHGPNTQGTAKGPSLINIRKSWKAPRIADQIRNGGQKMPSFEDSLSPEEINQLVAYLRARHRPAPAPAPVTTPSPATAPSAQPPANP
jgi:mono/diheme cytochrome c family protein